MVATTSKKWKKKQRKSKEEYMEANRAKYRKYYKKNREKELERKRNYYLNRRNKIIEDLGGSCSFCGIKDINMSDFNIHHTIPMNVFENKISHYLRHLDIMCLLCVDCHIMWHKVMDELGIDEIFMDIDTPRDFFDRM